MKKKLLYEVPDAELIELRLDEMVLAGSPGGAGGDGSGRLRFYEGGRGSGCPFF